MTGRKRVFDILTDHLTVNSDAPIASPGLRPGRRLTGEIHLALTGARIPTDISRSEAVEYIRAQTDGRSLDQKELDAHTLEPRPKSGRTMDPITSGSVSLANAARVFTFARDSGEVNWELIRPKDPSWAFDRIQHEVGRNLAVRSPADTEYACELPSIVMRYPWEKGPRRRDLRRAPGLRADRLPLCVHPRP